MKQLSSAQVRKMFLDFFKEKGHEIEPSASLVPKDDPTLLWINSGVATLKKNTLMDVLSQKILELQMHKNQLEQMILQTSVIQRDITPFLKCLVIFPLVIILKRKRLILRGSS